MAIEQFLHELLAKAHNELSQLSIALESDEVDPRFSLRVESPVTWADHERRLLGVLGQAFPEGHYCREFIELIEATERECLARLQTLAGKSAWLRLYPFLYVYTNSQTLPASLIFHGLRFRSGGRQWSQGSLQTLLPRFEDLERQSPGLLGLLVLAARDMIWDSVLEVFSYLPALIRRCWESRIYELRLEAVELGGAAAYKVQEPLRSELEAMLESFPGPNVWLNSAVFEALSRYKDLGVVSLDIARAEVGEVLATPQGEETFRRAAHLFTNQFEDVFQDHYSVGYRRTGRE